MTFEPIRDVGGALEVLRHARRRPSMWGLRTAGEAIAFLVGINAATGLLPVSGMGDWLHSTNDPKWGGRGGVGWFHRVAVVSAAPEHFLREDRLRSLSDEEGPGAVEAILRMAIGYLEGLTPDEAWAREHDTGVN